MFDTLRTRNLKFNVVTVFLREAPVTQVFQEPRASLDLQEKVVHQVSVVLEDPEDQWYGYL